jgi:hypothetical protein
MKYLGLFLGAAALLGAETNAERGKRIVDEALAALGGDKFLAMNDRIEDGRAYSFYREQLTGLSRAKVYTRYLDKPVPAGQVAQRERQAFGKDEDYLILFLEDKAYQVTYRGAKPIAQDRWERYVESTRRNIFYILRNRLNEPGLIFEFRGSEVWQNTPVDVVDITDADNNVVTVAFQRTTKLPLRETYTRRDPKTKQRDDYSVVFSKYRDVGNGVQWPYNMMSERNGEKVFEMFSDSVTINQNLPDETFQLKMGTKVLRPDKS